MVEGRSKKTVQTSRQSCVKDSRAVVPGVKPVDRGQFMLRKLVIELCTRTLLMIGSKDIGL